MSSKTLVAYTADNKKLRVNVLPIILTQDGNVFVGLKIAKEKDLLQNAFATGPADLPTGGVDALDDGTFEQAVWREMSEEIGITPGAFDIICKRQEPLSYLFPDPTKYDGKQIYPYAVLLRDLSLVDLSGKLDPEGATFCDYWLVPFDQITKFGVDDVKPCYEAIKNDFAPLADLLAKGYALDDLQRYVLLKRPDLQIDPCTPVVDPDRKQADQNAKNRKVFSKYVQCQV